MAFTPFSGFKVDFTTLATTISGQAANVKGYFNQRSADLKSWIDLILADLASTADGTSGADNIGATAITGVDGTTVQAQMESMKGLVDGKAASGHDHDSSYASASHDHDSSYAPIDLAGDGRTTETVKGNADDLATHLADTAQYRHNCRVKEMMGGI